ncbi:MAG: ring-cleaving dioxygenase [Bacteroidia bacterium]|nr:ring-cleaving dioxygenase [Bacteroidia bacterium]
MSPTSGLHHITCIAQTPQENVNFYSGVLGLRLVKRSVNQDDVSTYHLFYADAIGTPGTDLTFFPWPRSSPGTVGVGQATEVCLSIPPGSIPYWETRLRKHGYDSRPADRFGWPALLLSDPDGLSVALVEAAGVGIPWERSPVPSVYQLRGLLGATLQVREIGPTQHLLVQLLGFRPVVTSSTEVWVEQNDTFLAIQAFPDRKRGRWGPGTIHHLAFKVRDEAHLLQLRDSLLQQGFRPTPVIDRFWFKSVYFLEPGGILFELATEGPGFTADETLDELGEKLILPPWIEPQREQVERILPPIQYPVDLQLFS